MSWKLFLILFGGIMQFFNQTIFMKKKNIILYFSDHKAHRIIRRIKRNKTVSETIKHAQIPLVNIQVSLVAVH